MSSFLKPLLFTSLLLMLVSCSENESSKSVDNAVPKKSSSSSNELEDSQGLPSETDVEKKGEEVLKEEAEEKEVSADDLVLLEEMLSELKANANKYCSCMQAAKSSKDCKVEYSKLAFQLEDELNERLPSDTISVYMKKAAQIIQKSQECDKDFN